MNAKSSDTDRARPLQETIGVTLEVREASPAERERMRRLFARYAKWKGTKAPSEG